MTAIWLGPLSWELERDAERERTYTLLSLVECEFYEDGPGIALSAVGLPVIGQPWAHGNESDPYAICLPIARVTPVVTNEPNRFFVVQNTFSTHPHKNCSDEDEDPLLQRAKTSGNSIYYTKEARYDRHGNPLKTSSHEPIEGKDVEIEVPRHVVHIDQNVSSLELNLIQSMLNKLNDSPLWGMPRRSIRFAGWSWELVFLGICENSYIRRMMDFEIDPDTFDRCIPDYGYKALRGHWATEDEEANGETGWILEFINGEPPNPDNPAHFDRYEDRRGEVTGTYLDGMGKPLDVTLLTGSGSQSAPICISDGPTEILEETNFLLLGIPTDLESGV